MRRSILATACCAIVCASYALATDRSASAQDVVMGHMRAVGQKDLDAYVAGYADDAKIVTTSRVYSGHAEIREFASAWLTEFSKPEVTIDMRSLTFEGDTAIVVFSADTPDNTYNLVVETFFVGNGKIMTQTYAADAVPKK